MTFETIFAYRGISTNDQMESPIIARTRKDRRPRDMPFEIHQRADDWFLKNFGVRYRSQALFVTGNKFIAGQYAYSPKHVVRIIPLGVYTFCWSKIYSDLFLYKNSVQNSTIEEYLDAGQYVEGDLKGAVASGNEIMLFCDQYVAIPVDLLDEPEDKKPQLGIIVL